MHEGARGRRRSGSTATGVFVGDRLVGVGILQSQASVLARRWRRRSSRSASGSRASRATRSTTCSASATCCSAARACPALDARPRGPARSSSWSAATTTGRTWRPSAPYIRDVRPVLVGVDGGADALIEDGLRPRPDPRRHGQRLGRRALRSRVEARRRRRRRPTELVLHAYTDGRAPGRRAAGTRSASRTRVVQVRRHERGRRVPARAREARRD